MTTQIIMASTAFGLTTATAAYDSGAFQPCERRILVIACNTAMPEATTPMQDLAGVPDLMRRFDAVYDYNACIEPQHPSSWHPRLGDLPLWERYFRQLWKLGSSDLHLVVESIHVNPAQALCRIFGDARIDVYADGLMSYGPTRTPLPEMVSSRIERLLHLDLVPGLRPLLLSEQQVPTTMITTESFRAVAKTMVDEGYALGDSNRIALIIGQYLAANGFLSNQEELDLYAAMVAGCADAGYSLIAFKPHPSTPNNLRIALQAVADARGIQLLVPDRDEIAEAWFERGGVELVVGCFSTALMTASRLYGLPVARLGTDLMLERLSPLQNSNRIPVTIVDALVPELGSLAGSKTDLSKVTNINALVVAVGYTMQPLRLADRRSEAVAFLADHYQSHARYFKRRRLTQLGLPGGPPPPQSKPKRTIRRRGRRLIRRTRTALGRWLLRLPRVESGSASSPKIDS
jgi:Alpha-2,8-polysialyltransferase (POLYST)